MNMQRLREILARAKTKRILVIGDLMLDEFVWGKVGRISPEAPVPVVQVVGESFYPGGAANVARNLREFIDEVSVIGLVGSDRSGQQLRELLAEQQINTADTIEDAEFQTIVKTRIIARNQQVVRVDREQVRSLSPAQVSRIVDSVRRRLARNRRHHFRRLRQRIPQRRAGRTDLHTTRSVQERLFREIRIHAIRSTGRT